MFCSGKSFIFDTVDCGSSKKTVKFCCELLLSSIDKVKELYDKDVLADVLVCTDDENKMEQMCERYGT